MTVAQKTKTFGKCECIEKDAYVDESNPGVNYGGYVPINIGGDDGADVNHGLMTVKMPEKPADCDETQAHEGIVSITLYLYLYNKTAGSTSPHTISVQRISPAESWGETDVTYSNMPYGGSQISSNDVELTLDLYKAIDLTGFRELASWGGVLDFILNDMRGQAAHFSNFNSRDYGATATYPYIKIVYYAKEPNKIKDLTNEPYANDATRPVLKWSPNDESTFDCYELYKSEGGGAYALLETITEQATSEYVAAAPTQGVVARYKILVYNTDGCTSESNVTWLVRPAITTFAVSDTSPDVLQELTFTITETAIPATPTPVTNEWYEYTFGTSAQSDSSSCRVETLTRTHRYPHAGTQTPSAQIENSLGYKSDAKQVAAVNLTVASIVPVAILKASPLKVAINETIRFYGDQSYVPAGNKEIAAANGYLWDKDFVADFAADYTTTVPYQDMSWNSAGTKVVALKVKDEDAVLSSYVLLTIEVVTQTTVDLDSALTDPFDVFDGDRGRAIAVERGIEAKRLRSLGEKETLVTISGWAFTDTNSDGKYDDIDTLDGCVTNNSRVSLSVHGTTRYGVVASFKAHGEGGWGGRRQWTAQLYLE